MNDLPVTGKNSRINAQRIVGLPGRKHCKSLERNVRIVKSCFDRHPKKYMVLGRDQRFSPDSLFYQKWIWTMLIYGKSKFSFDLY